MVVYIQEIQLLQVNRELELNNVLHVKMAHGLMYMVNGWLEFL
jgi:hypothetical protein